MDFQDRMCYLSASSRNAADETASPSDTSDLNYYYCIQNNQSVQYTHSTWEVTHDGIFASNTQRSPSETTTSGESSTLHYHLPSPEINMEETAAARKENISLTGCGTGIQTRLLAALYPEATVVGIDPNPVPDDSSTPPNVQFILGRVEDFAGKHELQPCSFDLIYERYLIMSIKNWEAHVMLLHDLLKPSGWVEFQEMNICTVYDEHGKVVSNDWRFLPIFKRGGADRGIDFEIANGLPDICRDLGFDNISTRKFLQPFRSGWLAKPETKRAGLHFERTLPIYLRTMLERSVRVDEGEDFAAAYSEAEEKLFNGPVGLHFFFVVVLARKLVE